MILTGNRQDEIIARATKRLVTAMIYMSAPPQGLAAPLPGNMGLVIDKKKPVAALTNKEAFLENAEVWQWEDECVTPLAKGSEILTQSVEVIRARTKRVNAGEFPDLDTQKAVFNSKDVIAKATGIPSVLHYDFIDASKTKKEIIETVPFRKLRTYLMALDDKLGALGGQVTSADVAHADSMSAFEYYEIGFGHHMGHKFSYGDVIIRRATRMLEDIATRNAPTSKLN